MPYIHRSASGAIEALYAAPAPDAEEFLHPDAPELRAFLGADSSDSPGHPFADADAGLIRVVEDLVDVLIAKNLIRLTDLPVEAQQKLLARKDMRRRMKNALDLLDDGEVL